MPYIDGYLKLVAEGNSEASAVHHLHFGYWDEPATADGTQEDYMVAAERLTGIVFDGARIADGMRVIDCGCGVGGTVESLNERFSNVRLTGVNVDDRQLALARERVQARHGNEVDFVCADACDLPFDSESADALIALECIFHFPSRRRFLREAHRVLRPGGRLAITDCVPLARALPSLLPKRAALEFYGDLNPIPMTVVGYKLLGRATSMPMRDNIDITQEILPTFGPFTDLVELILPEGEEKPRLTADVTTEIFRTGQIRYRVISFEKA